MKNGFDLASLDTVAACNKPTEVEIRHPVSGAGIGVFISVLGKDSTAYKAKVRAFAEQSMNGVADASIDKLEARNLDALVAATVSWRTGDVAGKVILGGDTLDYSAENVRKVYTDILPVREQVQKAINDLGNFMSG